MKKLLFILLVAMACEGPAGPTGQDGVGGQYISDQGISVIWVSFENQSGYNECYSLSEYILCSYPDGSGLGNLNVSAGGVCDSITLFTIDEKIDCYKEGLITTKYYNDDEIAYEIR